jgi:hypothetical protein
MALLLLCALTATGLQAQTRRSGASRRSRPPQRPASRAAAAPADTRLTGLYRLDTSQSDDPRQAAQRNAQVDAFGNADERTERLIERLTSPAELALERRGRIVSIASSRAPRITFEADGADHTERATDGHTVRTRASLTETSLLVTSSGSADRDDDYSVSFDSLEEGRRLRVTRRIYGEQTGEAVVVRSIYNKISSTARFDIFNPQDTARASLPRTSRNSAQAGNRSGTARTSTPPPAQRGNVSPRPQVPPTLGRAENRQPARDASVLVVQAGTRVIATLNNDLTTATAREGDRFTLTVREPGAYAGAIIEGYVARVESAGRISGRAELALNFEQIRLRDGRTAAFRGVIEDVRTSNGEEVRINNEGGNVQESDSQSGRTAQRAAIGAAVGAIIGALASGGKGAAIGAAIGAGAGVGSIYIQGRDQLELRSGTELVIRASR